MGFLACLADSLGLPEPAQLRTFAASLSEALTERAYVFTVVLDSAPSAAWLNQEQELLDMLSKISSTAVFTMVGFFQGSSAAGAPLLFDFRVGVPAASALGEVSASEVARWSAYLHQRLAWECGGDVELAIQWAERGDLADIAASVGLDETLEATLGRLAEARFAQLSQEVASAWRAFASGAAAPSAGVGMWRQSHCAEWRPAPWLARALLRQGATGAARWQLRGCLVCRPLAAAILAACFDLETRLQARHAARLIMDTSSLSGRAAETHEAYIAGQYPALSYPPSHPAPPDRPEDVWLFASLGEVVTHLSPSLSRTVRSDYRDLVSLRNGIAHGHHVGWAQCQTLHRLSLRLA